MEDDSNNHERLKRARRKWKKMTVEERIAGMIEISDRCASLPVLDDHSADDILGYNENGIFD